MTRKKAPDPPGHDGRSAPVMTSWVFIMIETTRDIRFTDMRPLTSPVWWLVLSVRGRGRGDGAPMVAPMAGDGWVLVPAAASGQAAETRRAGDQSPDVAAVVEHLISLTNAFQEGRPPLAPNPQLAAAAHGFAAFTVHPSHGDRHTTVREDAGAFRVEPG
jgi:hypothetical protein